MHKIAIVVPTKDRAEDLRKMLASAASQTRKPDQLIVVDGSNPDVRFVVEEFAGALAIDYIRVFPPSLAAQRNAGMAALRPDITLAGYIDDDIVLEPAALKHMMAFWDAAGADVGGAAFNITNNPPPHWQSLKRWLGIDDPTPGIMLRSGFPSSISYQTKTIETDWLYGGATVWRREVIRRFPYDEWYIGTGYMEDVDYSFNVREHYRLALAGDARLAHYSHPVRPERQFLLGQWQVVNRMHLVRKFRRRGLSIAHAWIASIGLFILHGLQAAARLDHAAWNRAKGNLDGMLSEIRGHRKQLGGFLK